MGAAPPPPLDAASPAPPPALTAAAARAEARNARDAGGGIRAPRGAAARAQEKQEYHCEYQEHDDDCSRMTLHLEAVAHRVRGHRTLS